MVEKGEGAVSAQTLQERLRKSGDDLAEMSRVRLHRAISWLKRAEKEDGDHDARFIFLWIAFNAAYAHEFGFEQPERELLRAFIGKLAAADAEKRLHQVVFRQFSGPVRLLIENQFVFEAFWRALRDHDGSGRWKDWFEKDKKGAMKAVLNGDTVAVLTVVFDRLYVLRNQLVHGGATWNSKVNRRQVGDGVKLLHSLLPIIILLMLEHPELDLGGISYPVVG